MAYRRLRKHVTSNTSNSGADEAEDIGEETEGQVALKTLKGDHFDEVFEKYKAWIAGCNRQVYTSRTKLAKTDADDFFVDLRHVISVLVDDNEGEGIESSDSCLTRLIDSLDPDNRLDLYMALGKQKRKEEVDQSKGVRPKARVSQVTHRAAAARPKHTQEVVESESDEGVTYSTDGHDIRTSRSSKRVRLTQSSDRGEDDDYEGELEA